MLQLKKEYKSRRVEKQNKTKQSSRYQRVKNYIATKKDLGF